MMFQYRVVYLGWSVALALGISGCNPEDPSALGEIERLEAELAAARLEIEQVREQVASGLKLIDELKSGVQQAAIKPEPSVEELRRSLDLQQSEVRQLVNQRYPECRIERLWHEGLEMLDLKKPYKAWFLFEATGADGRQQSGKLPVFGDLSGAWHCGDFAEEDAAMATALEDPANPTDGETTVGVEDGSDGSETPRGGSEGGGTRSSAMQADQEFDLGPKMKRDPVLKPGIPPVINDAE